MDYVAVVGTTVGIYAMLALSLNLILGEAGQPSIGHAAFLGIGAYTAAILNTRYGVPFWLDAPLAALAAGLVGTILGAISLRLRADFLAVATIGINFVVVALFQYIDFFGGALGIGGIEMPVLMGRALGTLDFFLLTWVVVALVILLLRHLQSSWIGVGLRAIRDSEAAAAACGVPVARYKVMAFAIATFLAGLAGSFYAHFMTFISPSDFQFIESVTVLAMVVLGGRGSIPGVLLGAVLLGVAPEIFRPLADYRLLVYGTILVLVMRLEPAGLLGTGSYLRRLLAGSRNKVRGVGAHAG